MATTKKADDATTANEPSSDGYSNYSVWLSLEDQARLEECAKKYRMKTGSRESACSLARTFIQLGLAQFEKTGGLVVSV